MLLNSTFFLQSLIIIIIIMIFILFYGFIKEIKINFNAKEITYKTMCHIIIKSHKFIREKEEKNVHFYATHSMKQTTKKKKLIKKVKTGSKAIYHKEQYIERKQNCCVSDKT